MYRYLGDDVLDPTAIVPRGISTLRYAPASVNAAETQPAGGSAGSTAVIVALIAFALLAFLGGNE